MSIAEKLKAISLKDRKKPHLVTISMRVNPNVHEQLEELAKNFNQTQNWVMAQLIMLAHQEMKQSRGPK